MEVTEQRKLTCPVCGGEMRTVSRYDVEIDICNKCQGVWLDRGELNKIVDSVSAIYDNLHAFLPDDTAYQLKKNLEEEEGSTLVDRYDEDYDKNYLKKIFELDSI